MTTINEIDVKEVASQLGVTLTVDQINNVLELYPIEEENDPTGSWELIVENCIYIVLKPSKVIIKLQDWDHTCGDGCCYTCSTSIEVNGEVCEDEYAGEDVAKALGFVLNKLGIDHEILELSKTK